MCDVRELWERRREIKKGSRERGEVRITSVEEQE